MPPIHTIITPSSEIKHGKGSKKKSHHGLIRRVPGKYRKSSSFDLVQSKEGCPEERTLELSLDGPVKVVQVVEGGRL